MAKVIVTCGKICSGKSTYAEHLRKETNAVILSVDEIMLDLFGQNAGSLHDEYIKRVKNYLFHKSMELVETDINVILDLGLWTKAERKLVKEFFRQRNIKCEIHFLDISDDEWRKRINHRNLLVSDGKISAYFVDDELARKADLLFEKPAKEEVDVWIHG